MQMNSDAILFLGLMKRAGALSTGEADTGSAARAGKAQLILLAKDASDNAVKRAESFSRIGHCPLAVLEYTKEELGYSMGGNLCSMTAVTDRGFSDAFLKKYSTAFIMK